jgi:hypothetical protein
VLWLATYAVAIALGQQAGACIFPVGATLLNLGWEANFAFSRVVDSRLQRAIYIGWLMLDSVLFVQALRYGAAEHSSELVREHWAWLVGAGLGLSILGHHALFRAFGQAYAQAYATNLIMSAWFVVRIASPEGAELASLPVGWLKLFGTLLISAANGVSWWTLRRVPMVPLLAMLAILALDVTYIIMQFD